MVYKKLARESVSVGVVSMAGLGAMGALGGVSPHAASIVPIASSGLRIVNVGQLSKNAMGIVKPFQKKKYY